MAFDLTTDFKVFYPESYGAVGDGTTNDAAAFQAAINAIPTTGGVLVLSAKSYLINTGLSITKPVTIIGAGINRTVLRTSVANITLITYSNYIGISISGMTIANIATTTPTSGEAIKVTASTAVEVDGEKMRLRDLYISRFYNNVWMDQSFGMVMDGVHMDGFINYGLYLSNNNSADVGDQAISNCTFESGAYYYSIGATVVATETSPGVAAIRYVKGGGLKVTNTKFNWKGLGKMQYHIWCTITESIDMMLANNSFENFTDSSIFINTGNPGGGDTSFRNISITGNQFASYAGAVQAIKLVGATNVAITSNNYSSMYGAYYCEGTVNVRISGEVYYGMSHNNIMATASTNTNLSFEKPQGVQTIAATGTTYLKSFEGVNGECAMTGNVTVIITDPFEGNKGLFIVKQDATGGRVFTLQDATYVKSDGTNTDTINTAANAKTFVEWWYMDGTLWAKTIKV